MKKIYKGFMISFIILVCAFTVVRGDDCDDVRSGCMDDCGEDPVCQGECQNNYNICEGYQLESSSAFCEKYPDNFLDCGIYGGNYEYVSGNYEQGSGCCLFNDFCINLPEENGACPEGFTNVGNCCQPICPGNTYWPEGSTSSTECKECTGDTIPNSDHTKCICDSSKKCCGIQLNTTVPFIGNCIEMNANGSNPDSTNVSSLTAFPVLMQGLMKILMSAVLVFSFLMIIVAGLLMTTSGFSGSSYTNGTKILKNVIISLILLGCSGLILSLINPSFFGG